MQSIQADVKLLDAEVLVPHVIEAFLRALRPGAAQPLAAQAAAPGVLEAVVRLAFWDFSTPTGIREGYDASDRDGNLSAPSRAEIASSVAATIYAVFRGELIREVIDSKLEPFKLPTPGSQQAMTALRNLFDTFAARRGVGASGVDFFAVPGLAASAEDRRDLVVLHSLGQALQLLASSQFQAAFGGSANQDDYRWGKLHRIVFSHPMDSSFSVPPAFGFFPAPLAGLPGIPTDGGLGVVDASAHDARAASSNAFMFGGGPSNRLVVELRPGSVRAESVWPGGASGVPGSWNYLNLLPLWLTNDTVPLPFAEEDVERGATSIERFVP
jgi:penicillin amidase